MAERRKILKDAQIDRIIKLFSKFPLKTDAGFGLPFAQRIYEISRTYGLSSYDASYLELALRIHAPMATLDKQLAQAAEASGIALYR